MIRMPMCRGVFVQGVIKKGYLAVAPFVCEVEVQPMNYALRSS
jgi:hypothetical protein